jgi:2-keto-4-pentenoate hydratase
MHCAPLPAAGVLASPATQARSAFHRIALELEIGFSLGRDFTPRAMPYSADEVTGSIATMAATIEIVSSRYREWPNVDKFAQLADLQSHGALVVGESVPYRDDVRWLDAGALFTFTSGSESTNADVGAGGNPAGDPRTLLPWLVNHVVSRGMTLAAGTIVTTGSYTGLFLPDMPGTAVGRIAGLPPVTVSLT